MKKIIVPTDFSTCADNALLFALEMTKISKMEIVVIHILELETIYTDYSAPTVDLAKFLHEQAEQEMMNLKSRIMSDYNIMVQTITYQGPVIETIVQAAHDHNAELILIGTKGAGKIKEKLWGTHTASLISKSEIPILTVPKDYKWKKPAKILLVTNHFEKDQVSWRILSGIIDLFGATLHVVVFTDEHKDKAATAVTHNWEIGKYTEFLDQHYKYEVVSEHVYGADFEQTIEDYISVNSIDLLVMFTYKKSFFERLKSPSKTRKMSYHTKIPLLAIHGKKSDL